MLGDFRCKCNTYIKQTQIYIPFDSIRRIREPPPSSGDFPHLADCALDFLNPQSDWISDSNRFWFSVFCFYKKKHVLITEITMYKNILLVQHSRKVSLFNKEHTYSTFLTPMICAKSIKIPSPLPKSLTPGFCGCTAGPVVSGLLLAWELNFCGEMPWVAAGQLAMLGWQ